MRELWSRFPNTYINEAHNGYIEVYLNLGVVGLSLLLFLLYRGYRLSLTAFRRNPYLGSLSLTYMLAAALYNYAEAGFRTLCWPWAFLLLSVLAASAAARIRPNLTLRAALPGGYGTRTDVACEEEVSCYGTAQGRAAMGCRTGLRRKRSDGGAGSGRRSSQGKR